MKASLKYVPLWVPFIFAAALSGIVLSGWSQSSINWTPGFPAFFAFLPMAFLFSATTTQSHIARLERRIEALESRANPETGATPGQDAA